MFNAINGEGHIRVKHESLKITSKGLIYCSCNTSLYVRRGFGRVKWNGPGSQKSNDNVDDDDDDDAVSYTHLTLPTRRTV